MGWGKSNAGTSSGDSKKNSEGFTVQTETAYQIKSRDRILPADPYRPTGRNPDLMLT